MSKCSEHGTRNMKKYNEDMSETEAFCILHGAELMVLNRANDKFAQAYQIALLTLRKDIEKERNDFDNN